ncbi:MAG TPA: response regulator transcription factor [Steroidobacteraceae bacterium]|nr:response regulator transcription factor [Steroidobacteraceae bacterium]
MSGSHEASRLGGGGAGAAQARDAGNTQPGGAVRIMLVDDHAIVRAGFRRLLEQQPDFRVVAEAADADRAYALFAAQEPDVVIMDLSMPGTSGMEGIRRILARSPAARILVFSMHEDAALAARALELGARGYVTKSSPPEVLTRAVAEVAAGRISVSPDVERGVMLLRKSAERDPLELLGAREFEILRLLASGRAVADIARLLNLSPKTVANYHTAIRQKLQVASDVELVLLAQRRRLL